MSIPVLITQCLQRDFVDLVAAHAPLPNLLHVGREEALRLLGPDPAAGPVAQLMAWARAQQPGALRIIHVRDWHDPADPRQKDHLQTFGPHCLKGERGAEFVGPIQDGLSARTNERVVDAIGLNDFEGTALPDVIAAIQKEAGGEEVRVGVVGVWTEAKVQFLLYDLKTRCGIDRLATCSALDASASRAQHFNALDQMQKILGIATYDSVGDFAEWLMPAGVAPRLPVLAKSGFAGRFEAAGDLAADGGEPDLSDGDRDILGFLYRDSSRVALSPLGGGFSGARVFRVSSWDGFSHEQAPSVAKLGPRALIGAERAAFEKVESVLGNNAPSVRGFVDFGERAGIKYAFAAMGSGKVRTFKSLFESGAPQDVVDSVLRGAFEDVLGRLYAAAQYERLPLLEHYRFTAGLAPHVRANVERVVGVETARGRRLSFGRDYEAPNLCSFYEDFLASGAAESGEYHFVSFVHGDLNGANILVDGRENVWVIDFFHTARAHVLKDVAKLENDALYILTKISDEAGFEQALRITRALREVRDLREPLPERVPGVTGDAFVRAWSTVRTLRGIAANLARSDRDPRQMSIALLRYAAHTLSFDESSPLQKKWALAAACGHAEDIATVTRANREIRIDWVDPPVPEDGVGGLGITICPGRRDRGRDLDEDLDGLRRLGTARLLTLVTDEELEWAGVRGLRHAAERRGMQLRQVPIRDQGVPSLEDAHGLVRWIEESRAAGHNVVLHCMGGLGRAGTVAACAMTTRGLTAEEAIAAVRNARGPRAVEIASQADFVGAFARTEK